MTIHSIGIIGYGDFGQFLHMLASARLPKIQTKVYSSRRTPDGKDFFSFEEVCQTDLLILCVPIAAFEQTVERVLPRLGAHTILCDVTTIKTHTIRVLKKQGVPQYIATHPMFGPHSYKIRGDSLEGLKIAVCDSTLADQDHAQMITFLKELGLTVLEMSADAHDKLIAETLFLTHLVGQTVHRAGFERTSIDTISFGYLMDAVQSVAHDEGLFHDVYQYNPYCKEVLKRFESVQKDIICSLEARNSQFPEHDISQQQQ